MAKKTQYVVEWMSPGVVQLKFEVLLNEIVEKHPDCELHSVVPGINPNNRGQYFSPEFYVILKRQEG